MTCYACGRDAQTVEIEIRRGANWHPVDICLDCIDRERREQRQYALALDHLFYLAAQDGVAELGKKADPKKLQPRRRQR